MRPEQGASSSPRAHRPPRPRARRPARSARRAGRATAGRQAEQAPASFDDAVDALAANAPPGDLCPGYPESDPSTSPACTGSSFDCFMLRSSHTIAAWTSVGATSSTASRRRSSASSASGSTSTSRRPSRRGSTTSACRAPRYGSCSTTRAGSRTTAASPSTRAAVRDTPSEPWSDEELLARSLAGGTDFAPGDGMGVLEHGFPARAADRRPHGGWMDSWGLWSASSWIRSASRRRRWRSSSPTWMRWFPAGATRSAMDAGTSVAATTRAGSGTARSSRRVRTNTASGARLRPASSATSGG